MNGCVKRYVRSKSCERYSRLILETQHAKLNAWELLASMQALSIYLLVRLQEGETEYNNFDYLMLTTVIVGKLSIPD